MPSPAPTWARDRSCLKRPTRVRPAERLSEHVVEVRDELRRAGAQILERSEAGALEQAPRQDGEPDLDLVQPRTVARRVDEANPVGRVLQKRPARLLRLEDAGLALGAELILDTSALPSSARARGPHTLELRIMSLWCAIAGRQRAALARSEWTHRPFAQASLARRPDRARVHPDRLPASPCHAHPATALPSDPLPRRVRTQPSPPRRHRSCGRHRRHHHPTPPCSASRCRLDWASLLKRVFAADVLVCDSCGGAMRILAVVPKATPAAPFSSTLACPPTRRRPPRSARPSSGRRCLTAASSSDRAAASDDQLRPPHRSAVRSRDAYAAEVWETLLLRVACPPCSVGVRKHPFVLLMRENTWTSARDPGLVRAAIRNGDEARAAFVKMCAFAPDKAPGCLPD